MARASGSQIPRNIGVEAIYRGATGKAHQFCSRRGKESPMGTAMPPDRMAGAPCSARLAGTDTAAAIDGIPRRLARAVAGCPQAPSCRASAMYSGIPTAMLKGKVRPSTAVIDKAELASGTAMRIAVGVAM